MANLTDLFKGYFGLFYDGKYDRKMKDLIGFKKGSIPKKGSTKIKMFCNANHQDIIIKNYFKGKKFNFKSAHYVLNAESKDKKYKLELTTTKNIIKEHCADGALSKGHKFEHNFTKGVNDFVAGKGPAPDWLCELMKVADLIKIDGAKAVGGANNKRPIYNFDFNRPLDETMSDNKVVNIGKVIADVIVFGKDSHNRKKEIYCSLKMGDTTNFANQGITKWFKGETMSKGVLSVEGKALVEAFGIDEKKFCEVFNRYNVEKSSRGGANYEIVRNPKIDENALGNYIAQAIGGGYFYIKLHGNKVEVNYIDEKVVRKIIKSRVSVEVRYPKNLPTDKIHAKRVEADLTFAKGQKLKVVFRDKSGPAQIYPTFIMPEPKNWKWDF